MHALVLMVGLNFAGVIRVPHLEWLARDRLLGVGAAAPAPTPAPTRPRMAPARPVSAPVVAARPARFGVGAVAPAPTPRAAAAQPPALAEPPFGPEEARTMLAMKHLDRYPAGFVLDAESTVRSKLAALRSSAAASREARLRAEELAAIKERVAFLNREAELANERMAQLDFAMRQYPGREFRGRLWHGNTVADDAAYQQLADQKNEIERYRVGEVIPDRNALRQQLTPGAVEKAVEASGRKQQAGLEALDELREAVRAAHNEFVALSADQEATRALKVVGQSGIKVSREFLDAVKEMGVFERTAGRKASFPRSAWPEAWRKAE